MFIVDIHTHIGGIQRSKTGCFMSHAQIERLHKELPPQLSCQMRIAQWIGILDRQVQKRLLGFINEAWEVARAVVLPMDGIYDKDGKLDCAKTSFYVPNDYVLAASKICPKIIPAASINPLRRDWEEELELCVSNGAKLMKWLPSSQNFDPADPRALPFLKKLASKKIPLLSHTGFEHTIISAYEEERQKFGEPKRLIPALEAGVTVIMAHSGTSGGKDEPDYFKDFLELIERYPHLYGDTAAFTHWTRAHLMAEIFRHDKAMDRFVHGSDATLQPSVAAFESMVGKDLIHELSRMSNPLVKDLKLKKALGFPKEVFERGALLLGLGG